MAVEKERTQIKLFANAEEHKLLRFAALSRGVTLTDFIRSAALQAANEAMRDFVPPGLATPTQPAPRRKGRKS